MNNTDKHIATVPSGMDKVISVSVTDLGGVPLPGDEFWEGRDDGDA